ncbi:hypothetical protein MYX04_03775 [Nitrospiraceae bacterium AH_259_D15_M11_P09]|nr:hypothetical protein [Nitrospiraceae bacterium AH_259_D15_M11_P09]
MIDVKPGVLLNTMVMGRNGVTGMPSSPLRVSKTNVAEKILDLVTNEEGTPSGAALAVDDQGLGMR